jgi:hypothetical protein
MGRTGSKPDQRPRPAPALVGWREWAALPSLGLPAIKAKIDTGARTSALHAFYVDPYEARGLRRIRFGIHPLQGRTDVAVDCAADIVDYRQVTDSGGHRELRYVIEVPIALGGMTWPAEITLTNRDDMMFRLLVGRTAMAGRLMVDPRRSYVLGPLSIEAYARPSRAARPGRRRA